jgi:hypothetical protein
VPSSQTVDEERLRHHLVFAGQRVGTIPKVGDQNGIGYVVDVCGAFSRLIVFPNTGDRTDLK